MSVFKRGGVYWYHFLFAGRHIQESAKTTSKTLAKSAEQKRRRELEEGFNSLTDGRKDRIRTIAELADKYLRTTSSATGQGASRSMQFVTLRGL